MSGFSAGEVVARRDGLLASWGRLSRVARVVAWLAVALLAGAAGIEALNVASSPATPSAQLEREQIALARLQSLPVQAQSVISTAIGAGTSVFAPTRTAAGYRSTGGGVTAQFGAGRIVFGSHASSLSFSSLAAGRGGRLVALARGSVSAHANRVVYDRGTVAEWYAAGPLGIEQGFTVARRPAGVGRGLTLALGVGGGLRPQRVGNGVRFVAPSGRVAFRYGGLEATDALGRVLPVALTVRGARLLISVTDSPASYPIRIDPFIQQGGAVTPSDEAGPYGYYGTSVAVSSDGNTALIGAEEDGNTQPASTSVIDNGRGAVSVFTRTSGVWHQQGSKLVGNPGNSGAQEFGSSVSLSADGNTALIGADAGDLANFPPSKTGIGSAYIFTRAGGAWTRQTMIQPVNPTENYGFGIADQSGFGGEVALSGDGTTALVAGDDGAGDGQFWVFKRSGSSWAGWSQQGDLNQPSGAGAHTLTTAALSADGSTAAVGAFGVGNGVGSAWIYQRSGSSWTQQGPPLAPTDAIGPTPFFGLSVALSSDGNTALVGAALDGGSAGSGGVTPGPGAAFVFTRAAAAWSQQAKLTEAGSVSLGGLVGLTADGNTAVASGGIGSGTVPGAFEWTRSGAVWTSQGASPMPGLTNASSAALSGDGTTVVVGDDNAGDGVGTALVFTHFARKYTVSGTVVGDSCSDQSCSQAAIVGGQILVTGVGSNGSAVTEAATTGAGGAWSVMVPNGTYKAGPTLDGATFADLPSFAPDSLPITVDGADVPDQNFATCAVGGAGTRGTTRRATLRGVSAPPQCVTKYTITLNASIPHSENVDPSLDAHYRVKPKTDKDGYNDSEYWITHYLREGNISRQLVSLPTFPSCKDFSAADVKKLTLEHARIKWYSYIRGGKLGSASVTFAWNQSAQKMTLVSAPTYTTMKMTKAFKWTLHVHGKKDRKGACTDSQKVDVMLAPVLSSAAGGGGALTPQDFTVIAAWNFPFDPAGSKIYPDNTLGEVAKKVIHDVSEAIDSHPKVKAFYETGKLIVSVLAVSKVLHALKAISVARATSFFSGEALASVTKAISYGVNGAHALAAAHDAPEALGIIGGLLGYGEEAGGYPLMSAVVRGHFQTSTQEYGERIGGKLLVPTRSTLAVSATTTQFPDIAMTITRTPMPNPNAGTQTYSGILPWLGTTGLPNAANLFVSNSGSQGFGANPTNLLSHAETKFTAGSGDVEELLKEFKAMKKVQEAVRETGNLVESETFGAENKITPDPECTDTARNPEVKDPTRSAGVKRTICWQFIDGLA